MTTFHIVAVLATVWASHGDRVKITDVLTFSPDKTYTSLTACRDAMEHDPGVHSAVEKTAHNLTEFIETSHQPGKHLASLRDVIVCANTDLTIGDIIDLE